jgi:ABC-type transport system involved in cytochrome c biogenesis permease subunit
VQSVIVGEGEGGTAVSTLTRPTVAEIRTRAASPKVPLDPRERAMQETAGLVKPLATYIYRAMQVGVLLITAGTMLGGFWADVSWGRFWGWDPKEVWALITLLVYLVPLHGRFAGWINTFGLVAASVGCFLSVVFAWYGVNFVLGVGLHSYGFTEGGGQFAVWPTCAAVLGITVAAGWRRHRAKMVVGD